MVKATNNRGASTVVAMITALAAALLVAIAVTVALYEFFPYGPVHIMWRLLIGNDYDISASPLSREVGQQINLLDMFVVSPSSMLAIGLTLGRMLGNGRGTASLYFLSALTSFVLNLAAVGLVWYLKLQSENFHLTPYDLPPSVIISQIFALIFWVGMSVFGAEIGRRFSKPPVLARSSR